MSRSKWIAMLAVAALLVAAPALAGSKKCTLETQECLNMMAHKMKNSGWVGVELEPKGDTGLFVITAVVDGSPASVAGLMEGDVIFAVNGVKSSQEDQKAMWKVQETVKPGETATWSVKRNGAPLDIQITLAPMPADVLAKWIGQHMIEHASVEVAEN